MSPDPPVRRISKRAAALHANDKVKADLKQFSQWEQKEKEVEDLKAAAMLNDERKPAAVPDRIDDIVPPQQGAIEDLEGTLEDSADDSSTLNSNSVSTTSPCPSITDESDEESSTDDSTVAITMTLSEMKRCEDQAIREQKAIERCQHSGREMFLSRRLSRKIRYSRRDEGRSPTLSPIVATALVFSPELAVHSKYAPKSRNNMIKQTSRNKITKKKISDNIDKTETFC